MNWKKLPKYLKGGIGGVIMMMCFTMFGLVIVMFQPSNFMVTFLFIAPLRIFIGPEIPFIFVELLQIMIAFAMGAILGNFLLGED